MFSEKQARKIMLDFVNAEREQQNLPLYEVTTIQLTERSDYWVISIDFRKADPEGFPVGVSGYLLDNSTGEIIVCGSNLPPEVYVQDKYDREDAQGKSYVLSCTLDDNKCNVLNLKKNFGISYSESIDLIRNQKDWLTGKKRYLMIAQEILARAGISTTIKLVATAPALVKATQVYWWQDEIINDIKQSLKSSQLHEVNHQ